MNLAGVVESLATGTYTVTRTAPGTYGGGLPVGLGGGVGSDDGRYRPGATSTFAIRASVQPLAGRDLLRLPEGLRTRQTIKVYTATALRTADAPDGAGADVIAYQGDSYQIETVEPWAEAGGFYKAIAAKVQT